MDATTPTFSSRIKITRWLPYWAVFQADLKQTFNGWLYRVWVLLSMSVALGYLLYRYGAKQVSGMIQPAHDTVGDLLYWVVYGSITLIVALTAGTICSERGTMADSVLSRGISRYQYFLGKWHARLALVLSTYFFKGILALVGASVMLHSESLSLTGSVVALVTVASLLMFVVTFGVTVSAMANSTLVSIAIVWMTLYGGGFVLSQLPGTLPSPERALHNLPNVLRGFYDGKVVSQFMLVCLCGSIGTALVGMVSFSRRDV
jgi:ABC-2 type transport system permease protein